MKNYLTSISKIINRNQVSGVLRAYILIFLLRKKMLKWYLWIRNIDQLKDQI